MSRFNEYARKADAYAKAVFEEYAAAESKLKAAESKRNAYPRKNGLGYEYDAKAARYEAEYVEAKAEYEKLRRDMRDYKIDGIRSIRKDLEASVSNAFAADPKMLDAATLELLKSGIMSASEYNRLMDKAAAENNPTMVRVIAKYAKDRADSMENQTEARAFKAVAYKGNNANGNDYLQAFDYLGECFARCMRNPAMIREWDNLTGELVEIF